MIKYFVNGQRGVREVSEPIKDCWIHLEEPSAAEIKKIAQLADMPESFLNSALDEEEAAHIDFEDNARLIVIDIPKLSENEDEPPIYTMPLAIVQNENYLVTVCLKATTVLDDFIEKKIKNVDLSRRNKFIYQIMYNNFSRFLYYLKQIDKTSTEIQKSLSKSMQNKELLELFGLQKSLVFFSASLTANYAVVQKIINANMSKSDEEEREILEDILIEGRQAMEMCSVYREILKGSMDAFASIVNNNQNIVMKFLTAVTIILTVPMVISGFWGMNTGVPFGGSAVGFWVMVGISLVIAAITTVIMIRRKML